jgi:ribonuclease HI
MPAKKKPAPSMRLSEDVLYIFTDGSVEPNPGPGGWGVLLIWNGYRRALCGGGKEETNNTMELTAILQGLSNLTEQVPTKLFSDSQYCVNALTRWADGWEKRGWTTREGEPVKNKKLIQVIRKNLTPDISLHWLKGHAGNVFNEMADYLARRGRDIYGLGLTEYNGPIDLSPLNEAMAHLKKEGDPPFEPGEEDLPFPVVSFTPTTFEEESDGLAEKLIAQAFATRPKAPPDLDVAALLKEVKETRGLVRRAEEKLKALEKTLKEVVK